MLAIFLSDLQDDVCDDDSCVSGGRNFGRSQSMPMPTEEDEAVVFRMAEAAAARRASAESVLARPPKKPTNHVNIDLSCKNATIKKEEEMSRLLSRGMSIKERMAIYKANTENDNDTQDVLDIDKARREELEDAMKDPSLTEKEQTDKMKEIRAKYGMMEMQIKIDQAKKSSVNTKKVQEDDVEITQATRAERELTKGRRSSVDLSAKSVAVKKAQELTSIQRQSSNIKDRLAMLKEAQSKKDLKEEEVVRSHLQVVEDENATARRNELMKIMRRRSLCKEEKEIKMQEVKQKYAEKGPEDEQVVAEREQEVEVERREEVKAVIKNRRLSSEERKQALNIIKWKYSTSSSSSTVPVPATRNLTPRNAKSYAQRRRSSLEALEQAIGSDGKSYAQRRRSSIEQLQQNIGSSGPTRVLSLRERIALLGTH